MSAEEMAICMKFSQLLLPSLNSRGEEFTSDNRNQTVIVIVHRYMVSTRGQVNLYHAGDPTSRSFLGEKLQLKAPHYVAKRPAC